MSDKSKYTVAYEIFSIFLKEERLSARVKAKARAKELIMGLDENKYDVKQVLKDLDGIST